MKTQVLSQSETALTKELREFFGQHRLFSYKKHEIMQHPFDLPSGLSYIKSGYVRLYSHSKDGEELTRIILGPNDFFPIRWVLTDEVPDYYIIAMTNVELWRVPKDQFLGSIKTHPDFLIAFTGRIIVRMGRLYKRMEALAFGHASSKVATILALGADRFGEKQGNDIIIPIPFTHKDLGSLIGLARETTSHEMEKLEKKGIIGYQGHLIVIRDFEKLINASDLDASFFSQKALS